MIDVGQPYRLTETGVVITPTGRLHGFFVTKVGGTFQLHGEGKDDKPGKELVGPITPPAVGWYPLPIAVGYRFRVVIEGELDLTFSAL